MATPRADFFHEEFDTLVTQKGAKVDWEQAIVCQCLSNDSNQPDFNCPYCGGSGFRYFPAKQIRVVVTSFSSSVKLETLGIREPGTAYATPTSDVIMGYRDRLTFVDYKCKYSEAIRFNPELGSRVSSKTYRNIKEVISLIQGDIMYEEGIDFRISDDGYHIEWIGKDYDPSLEYTTMGILYLTTPRYLVTDLLHELRATYTERHVPQETFVELPKQYQIRREDFVYEVNEPMIGGGDGE